MSSAHHECPLPPRTAVRFCATSNATSKAVFNSCSVGGLSEPTCVSRRLSADSPTRHSVRWTQPSTPPPFRRVRVCSNRHAANKPGHRSQSKNANQSAPAGSPQRRRAVSSDLETPVCLPGTVRHASRQLLVFQRVHCLPIQAFGIAINYVNVPAVPFLALQLCQIRQSSPFKKSGPVFVQAIQSSQQIGRKCD